MAAIPIDEPRPRETPLTWASFEPRCRDIEMLPIPVDPKPRSFGDVLRSRHSIVGNPVDRFRIAELLWHAAGTKGHAPAGRAGMPIELRAAPSAGGLHPISIVCIPEAITDGVLLYDPREHAYRDLDVDQRAIVAANTADVVAVVNSPHGYTLRLFADIEKTGAAYDNPITLVYRDVGCLIGTLCLCAEWLGLAACPLGFLGQSMITALGFPEPRFHAVGGVQISMPR